MLNIFAFSSLASSFLCFFLGTSVYYSNRKKEINQIFLLMCFSIFYWSFTNFMLIQAESLEAATMWAKMGFLWPFSIAFLFHFILIFSQITDFFGNKYTVFLLYAPASIFSFFELTTNQISGELVKGNWGYMYAVTENSFLFWLSSIWLFTLGFFGLILCLNYYTKETGIKKKQAKCISIGFSITLLVSLVNQMLPKLLEVQLPDFTVISITALCGFVGYAIRKYDLFVLNPITASEKIISTMPDALILLDNNEKILEVNKSAVNILGYTKNELAGKPFDLLFVDKKSAKESLKKLIQKSELKNCETEYKTKTNKEVFVSISASLVRDKEGKTQGAVVIIRDITEKKQLEKNLVASEKMAAIGQAATMVGHDLRNPLQAIGNATHLIKKAMKNSNATDPNIKNSISMLQIIEDSIDYANNIVIDLKDFSSERKPDFKKVDLNEVVKDSLAQCKPPKNVKIVTELESIPFVHVDKYMSKRVFVNIITNSIQAMEKKGGVLRVSTKRTNNLIEVSFQDTGIGMSKETLEAVFTPFFTTKAQGMGMGLPISKKFVESNGGFIKVESEEGKGSKFTITLPYKNEKSGKPYNLNKIYA